MSASFVAGLIKCSIVLGPQSGVSICMENLGFLQGHLSQPVFDFSLISGEVKRKSHFLGKFGRGLSERDGLLFDQMQVVHGFVKSARVPLSCHGMLRVGHSGLKRLHLINQFMVPEFPGDPWKIPDWQTYVHKRILPRSWLGVVGIDTCLSATPHKCLK